MKKYLASCDLLEVIQWPKKLRGRYILEALEKLLMSGDAFTLTTSDQLYRACQKSQKELRHNVFQADRAFLIRNEFLVQEGQRLYFRKTSRYEGIAAEFLSDILRNNHLPASTLPEMLTSNGIPLTTEQRDAVQMALGCRLSIILGGAGTGKSTLIQALTAYRSQNTGYVLCAPTGKAACNLRVRSGLDVRTVHGALGLRPEEDFLQPIPWEYNKLVVVDEASMMTLEMLAGILIKMPSDCRLVLVGDPNQLQSVGSGNVLPDLVELGIPYVRLEICHRQEADATALLHNVRRFDQCRHVSDLLLGQDFQFLQMNREEEVKSYICNAAASHYLQGDSVQVLSPFNVATDLSVRALNADLHGRVNLQSTLSVKTPQNELLWDGDRVMVTENDWEVGVCNGDIGTLNLLNIEKEKTTYSLTLPTGQLAAWYNQPVVRTLTQAYAITVHKSQGSEYDTVYLPIMRNFSGMMNRNLLYTAISRGKKQVVLVGDPDTLELALQKLPPKRRSMLVQKIHMRLEKSA
ncbi:MAG: AAA family ATPase [Oscillospiraceae bacterium]